MIQVAEEGVDVMRSACSCSKLTHDECRTKIHSL